jgi:hypothetical protein
VPGYRVQWLELAARQYQDLSDSVRVLVDQRLAELRERPTDATGVTYNAHSDQYSVPLGELGYLYYALVPGVATLFVLRLVSFE